ncbi:Uncharacterised protein [Vibrio cholerae]|nr:Uncharacterised protein [Vibrio cholerae]
MRFCHRLEYFKVSFSEAFHLLLKLQVGRVYPSH